MEGIAMAALRVLAGGGAIGALVVFGLVFAALSWLGALALPIGVAVTALARAIARVWGYALA
jgi:hypothetical protein